MKILRIISSIDPREGGPMEAAKRIDAGLTRQGHDVEVVCLDEPSQPYLAGYPVKVHALGPAQLSYRYSSKLVPWLRANRRRFDAVIVDGLWQYPGFGAWRALSRTDTPYFVYTHGMLDPWFKQAYPIKHVKKWLYWPWAEYRVLRDAKAVLFTCEEERRLARGSFWLYRANEVVSAYGTEPPPSDPTGQLAASFRTRYTLEGKRIMLFLSRIHEKKGCDLLIQAFARVASLHPDLHLVMAGPDQSGWLTTLQQQAKDLGIENRITWPGMLQGNDKWGAFHACEAFCLPSHQENFGIVVAEALACGKPVLISNKVNIWREIEQEGAGIVFEDTVQGTESGLKTWLGLPDGGRQAMVSATQPCFSRYFHINQVVESLSVVLSKLAPFRSISALVEANEIA